MKRSLVELLEDVGVQPGDVVLLHSSMRAVSRLVAGPREVIEVLQRILGPQGTLSMPAFSPQLCHPAARPKAPANLAPSVPRDIPLFEPAHTPVGRKIGIIPECFRHLDGVVRSNHPLVSFTAWGAASRDITKAHPLAYRLSLMSPLGELAERSAKILMLGTSWQTCTAIHLAEYAASYPGRRTALWEVRDANGPEGWSIVEDLLLWEGDYDGLGRDFIAQARPRGAAVGQAEALLVSMPELVAFATRWLEDFRDLSAFAAPPGVLGVTYRNGVLPEPD